MSRKPRLAIYGIEYTDSDRISSVGQTFYTEIESAEDALKKQLQDGLEDNRNSDPDSEYSIMMEEGGHCGHIMVNGKELETYEIIQRELE